jgi:tRNA pseudouridine38-40 synthase
LLNRKYINSIEDSGFEAASRTDRFVSARGACFTCILNRKPILMEINSALPAEIGVWAYAKVPLDFFSRYNAILRHYIYIVPRSLLYHMKNRPLNIGIMQKACRELEGHHDFINFSKRGKAEKTTIRDMDSVELRIIQDFCIFHFKSRAFLRQQVRRMVAKILELGRGDIDYETFVSLLNPSEDISYQPADPRGLILWDVIYDKKVLIKEDQKSKERMIKFFMEKKRTFEFKYHLFNLLQQDDFGQ